MGNFYFIFFPQVSITINHTYIYIYIHSTLMAFFLNFSLSNSPFCAPSQILINGVWMVIAPSHAMYHHPTREDNMLVCDSYIDASYMIAFFYPIVLIVICTVYAVLTRKIPEAFNESKHIGEY